MDRKITSDNCTDMRDQISEWWDDLSEDDMNLIHGDQEQLINLLQERYGYTRNMAFLAFMELKIHMASSAWKSRVKRIAPLGL